MKLILFEMIVWSFIINIGQLCNTIKKTSYNMNKTFKSFRNAVGSVLLVLAFGLFQCPAFAQLSRTITGIVSDQNGDP